MKLKEIDADAADTLWALGVDIWFKTEGRAWKKESNAFPTLRPFWKMWIPAVAKHNPKLAVEVE